MKERIRVHAIPPPEKIWSNTRCRALKGIFALAVLWCHVSLASELFLGSILSPLFGSFGYLSVSVFFFISGYGIMEQAQNKRDYLKTFPKCRILSIWVLNLFLVVVYTAYFCVVRGILPSFVMICQSLTIGNSVVGTGWYLQVVVLFYLLFWISFSMFSEKRALRILEYCICTYIILASFLASSTWYECSLSFLMGVIWSQNKQKIDTKIIQKSWYKGILISGGIFVISFLLSAKAVLPGTLAIILRRFFKILSSPTFVLLVGIVISRMDLSNKCLEFLGKYSLDIYVLQGLFLDMFKRGVLRIDNGWRYISVVIICTIIAAVLLHGTLEFVMNIPRNIRRDL